MNIHKEKDYSGLPEHGQAATFVTLNITTHLKIALDILRLIILQITFRVTGKELTLTMIFSPTCISCLGNSYEIESRK